MRALAAIALLLVACSGEAGDPPVEETESDAIDVIVPIPPARDPEVPLCDGETGPEPGDCQTLVYKLATGYCERFSPCSGL